MVSGISQRLLRASPSLSNSFIERELLFFPLQVFILFWIAVDSCIVIYLSCFNPFWSLYFLMLSCPACGQGGPFPSAACHWTRVRMAQAHVGAQPWQPRPQRRTRARVGCGPKGTSTRENLLSRQSPVLLQELARGSCNALFSGGNNACSQPLKAPLSLFNLL